MLISSGWDRKQQVINGWYYPSSHSIVAYRLNIGLSLYSIRCIATVNIHRSCSAPFTIKTRPTVHLSVSTEVKQLTRIRSAKRGICPIAAVCTVLFYVQTLSLKYPGRDLDLEVTWCPWSPPSPSLFAQNFRVIHNKARLLQSSWTKRSQQ